MTTCTIEPLPIYKLIQRCALSIAHLQTHTTLSKWASLEKVLYKLKSTKKWPIHGVPTFVHCSPVLQKKALSLGGSPAWRLVRAGLASQDLKKASQDLKEI